jgi:hypothetical protein
MVNGIATATKQAAAAKTDLRQDRKYFVGQGKRSQGIRSCFRHDEIDECV